MPAQSNKPAAPTRGMAVVQNAAMLITAVLMLLSVAVMRDGTIVGHKLSDTVKSAESIITTVGGETIVHTAAIDGLTDGYGGSVPLDIHLSDGKIRSIDALPNAETPEFFARVKEQLIPRYIGMTPREAISSEIDGVSGATFSSRAVIDNIRAGMEYADTRHASHEASDWREAMTPGFFASLAVVLAAAILPLFTRSKTYRIIQLALNILILGLWTATFINYTMMLRFLSGGIDLWLAVVPLLMLVTAFIYPLFGRKNHYCLWVCPFGSLQELAGRCSKRKWHISPRVNRILDWFRVILWAALMMLMWSGVWFGWIDYELFSAFAFSTASIGVILAASAMAILSMFINRPYCRFICPTGTLFKISETSR